jgi:hypothetical protein
MKTKEYKNKWIINGIPFEDEDIKEYAGFVYLITDLENGMQYIGKKLLHSRRKNPKTGRSVTTISDYKTYYSSSLVIKSLVKIHGPERFARQILRLCHSIGECSYWEEKLQFQHNILLYRTKEQWYNSAIGKRQRYYTDDDEWLINFLKDKET